ncbi:hypothetical protein Ab1vBOLIVR5_gp164c [Agrobacterium phage OLIVR5]|uniref:Uncharacterized protein n=1 Tax=Agrobacterium phage OLIVR5 TaxID=2723773 RepID=A0A858MSU9_9CAUD|nr:hypothetical protein KNU99_gp237 [Agrobacterium phage OLIVR5]QIW87812.1 hypothetical protein Ab1vBOLIVR5_gp164c [Agrobacterium phage OLIVR5]QIW88077.1 hypothetical protein Ab1vBOLIVR6_gp170c [Agrobacterium phage OLIVR6]
MDSESNSHDRTTAIVETEFHRIAIILDFRVFLAESLSNFGSSFVLSLLNVTLDRVKGFFHIGERLDERTYRSFAGFVLDFCIFFQDVYYAFEDEFHCQIPFFFDVVLLVSRFKFVVNRDFSISELQDQGWLQDSSERTKRP